MTVHQLLPRRAARLASLTAVLLIPSALFPGTARATAVAPGREYTTAARLAAAHTPGAEIAARAMAAMKAVRTVQSRGTFGASFTGVCVMSEPRARLNFQTPRTQWEIVLISKPAQKDWERYRSGAGPWGKWEAQATGPGDFNFPLDVPLACPRISLHDWRIGKETLHFLVSGIVSVGGRQTWHVHATAGGPAFHTSVTKVDWYVDKSTFRLLRRQFTQVTATGKVGYSEDVSYFGFDSSVTVVRPPGAK